MNILILTWLFPPSTGGVETYTYNLAKSLSKDYSVSVLTTGKKYSQENKERFKIYRLKEMYPYGHKEADDNRLEKALRKILLAKKISLIHSHNLICLPTRFSLTIIRVARELNIHLVDHCHDARYKNLNKSLAKEDMRIIAISNFVKKRLMSIGCNKNNITTINNSVDPKTFDIALYNPKKTKAYFGLPVDKKIILFPSRAIRTTTGQFGRQKSFATLLNAASLIKKDFNDFAIVFPIRVGLKENKIQRNKTLKKLEQRLENKKIKANVLWIKRRVRFDEMPSLYSTADIMCTPSINEAFGLVFLEAMSMSIPVIGARSGAVPELINNGKTGFLISPGNSKELAKVILKLLKSKELRSKIGENERKEVIKRFTNKTMLRKIKKVYMETIKNEGLHY